MAKKLSYVSNRRIVELSNTLKVNHKALKMLIDEPRRTNNPITVLKGERATSLERALSAVGGRYPVNCQWVSGGVHEIIDTIESESDMRKMYAVPSQWGKHQYLVIRPIPMQPTTYTSAHGLGPGIGRRLYQKFD